ncbi:MAG: FAD-dependent oxidoreductase [Armatimonadetes bacterium]|nr:FAD-dependent oxidoreductase [Armatimonadota bacterium]
MEQHDTPIILGGGIAGIAAAIRLAQAGACPTLIESRPYLGGRLRSFIHPETGDEIDNGQHLLMGCYHSTLQLLEALGTRHLLRLQPTLSVQFRNADGTPETFAPLGWLPWRLGVAAGMLRLKQLSFAERVGLLQAAAAIATQPPAPTETAAQYLQRLKQSPRACQRLWDPIIIATLNTPPDQAAASLFVRVMQLAFLGSRADSQLGFASGGLSALHAPTRNLIEQHGGRVIVGAPITGIELQPAGQCVIRLKERGAVVASQVISTLPHASLRNISCATILHGIPSLAQPMPVSPIVSLYLWFDSPLRQLPAFAAMIGTGVQWMFNKRKIAPAQNVQFPGLLSCTISAAVAESATRIDQVVATAVQELRGAFPEMGEAQLLAWQVIKEKHATFAATPTAEAQRPPTRSSIPGFFLAGDWVATGLPGTIEGAVQSGFAAAELVLQQKQSNHNNYYP